MSKRPDLSAISDGLLSLFDVSVGNSKTNEPIQSTQERVPEVEAAFPLIPIVLIES